jgi:mannose-1-phosphate guanylyltransferase/phosphomannomutase
MQALILCAGLGTRLRPLTDVLPKPMVPIDGKPLLERHIEQFKKHGICEFLINLHYLSEKITDYFSDGSRWGIKIIYKYEPEILGTAGAIKNFENEIKGPFFLIYGDIFSLVDYEKFYKAFCAKPGVIGMEIIGETDHPFDSDLAEIDNDSRLLKIHRKPHKILPKNFKAMKGVYIFKKEIINYIPKALYYEIDHQLLPDILNQGLSFYGYQTNDYLRDIGTFERYQKCQKDYKYLKKL